MVKKKIINENIVGCWTCKEGVHNTKRVFYENKKHSLWNLC